MKIQLAIFLLLIMAGCSTPTPGGQGPPSCAGGLTCPFGLTCAWDTYCYGPGKAPPNPDARDLSIPIAMPDLTPPCTQSSCAPPTPICDPNSGECVGCLIDTNCAPGRVCSNTVCIAGCSIVQGCGDGGTCDVDAGQCRGCRVDGDCGDPKNPRCNPANGACVACLPTNDNCANNSFCATVNGMFQCSMGCKVDGDCMPMQPDGGVAMRLACCNHVCADLNSDSANCGKCMSACANGSACCSATCIDKTRDINNCGGCGKACTGQNAVWQCNASSCVVTGCTGNYQDCNKSPSDGCEVNVATDPLNCLGCGNICSAPNGVAGCNNGCVVASCNPGFADCDNNVLDGCEDNVLVDPKNCGGCMSLCNAAPNATAGCIMGLCGIGICLNGFGDCDKLPGDGCESNLNTDTNNCGACGNVCPKVANGTGACVAGVCGVGTCKNGFQDCNKLPGDGCEANLSADPNNCGGCGKACAGFPHAAPACSNSACGIGACIGTFMDCNGNPNDGCEVDTSSDINNCGGCGSVCGPLKNASPVCQKSLCVIASCNQGFADCNMSPGDGCEIATGTDSNNCGACGTVCPNGQSCTGGVCVTCGNNCWGPSGCMTAGGHCIQFTCRAGNSGGAFCNGCKGWKEVTYSQWLNGGYCADVIATYRTANGTGTQCGGGVASCCAGSPQACGGGDNAWHFFDTNSGNNYYVGPCLGCNGNTNCTYWNSVDNSSYTRITVCEHP